jgi:hypothetical protein
MKRKLTPGVIDTPPLPASSVRCLHYRPAGMDMLNLSHDARNVICVGTAGSGKTFDMYPLRYLQHSEKGRVS